jgi:uncharacterized membrane protein
MGGSMGAFAGLAEAAYIESMAAAAIIPAAWPVVAIIYEGQSDPQQIWDGADGWKETVDELEKAQRKIEELTSRLSEDEWKGDDRDAFEERTHDYVNQLDFAIVTAWAVTVTLYVIAVMIAIFIGLMFVVASLLAIFAMAIAIALATVVGAPEAAALEADATMFANGCRTTLQVASDVLKFTFWGASGVLGGFLAGDMIGQSRKGNKDSFMNLGQATLNGADDMLKGTMQYLEQKLTAKAMQGKGNTILGRDSAFGRNFGDIPEPSRLPIQKGAGSKGLADVFNGGPIGTGWIPSDSYGSEDGDKNGRPDGEEYVGKTQPHR